MKGVVILVMLFFVLSQVLIVSAATPDIPPIGESGCVDVPGMPCPPPATAGECGLPEVDCVAKCQGIPPDPDPFERWEARVNCIHTCVVELDFARRTYRDCVFERYGYEAVSEIDKATASCPLTTYDQQLDACNGGCLPGAYIAVGRRNDCWTECRMSYATTMVSELKCLDDKVRSVKLIAPTQPSPLPAEKLPAEILAEAAASAGSATAARVTGDAWVERNGQRQQLKPNTPVRVGDRVVTGNGQVQIIFNDGSKIEVGRNGDFSMEPYEKGLLVRLNRGFLRSFLTPRLCHQLGWGCFFHVPTAVATVRGTEFIASHDDTTNTSSFHLYEGILEVTPVATGRALELRAGNVLVIQSNGETVQSPLSQAGWNELSKAFASASFSPNWWGAIISFALTVAFIYFISKGIRKLFAKKKEK